MIFRRKRREKAARVESGGMAGETYDRADGRGERKLGKRLGERCTASLSRRAQSRAPRVFPDRSAMKRPAAETQGAGLEKPEFSGDGIFSGSVLRQGGGAAGELRGFGGDVLSQRPRLDFGEGAGISRGCAPLLFD